MSNVKIPVFEQRRGDDNAVLGYIGQPSQALLARLVSGDYGIVPKVRRDGKELKLVSLAFTRHDGNCEVGK